MKKKFLISYDISDNKIRKKVVDLLDEVGIRWQFSVFFCKMSVSKKNTLVNNVLDLIEKMILLLYCL